MEEVKDMKKDIKENFDVLFHAVNKNQGLHVRCLKYNDLLKINDFNKFVSFNNLKPGTFHFSFNGTSFEFAPEKLSKIIPRLKDETTISSGDILMIDEQNNFTVLSEHIFNEAYRRITMKKFEIKELKTDEVELIIKTNNHEGITAPFNDVVINLTDDERRELENVLISYNQKKIMEKNNIK
jgi:hypothetical protein